MPKRLICLDCELDEDHCQCFVEPPPRAVLPNFVPLADELEPPYSDGIEEEK